MAIDIDWDSKLEQHKAQYKVTLAVIARHPEIHKELREELSDLETEMELTRAASQRLAQYNALLSLDEELVDIIAPAEELEVG